MATATATARGFAAESDVGGSIAPFIQPPYSVVQYIKGMRAFRADEMWNSLDATAIASMIQAGGSEEKLQRRLDLARSQGAFYSDITYIGGYNLKSGDSYYFYVVDRNGFTSPGVEDQVFFVFVVGPNGKIVKIE